MRPKLPRIRGDICPSRHCWWDCKIRSHPEFTGQAIINPECLKDCFDQISDTRNRDTSCLISLIEDVTTNGTCEVDDPDDPSTPPLGNPAQILSNESISVWGWTELDNDCIIDFITIEGEDSEYDL